MQITNGTQTVVGSQGYIVSFDMSDYDINYILGVHARTTSLSWSDPVTSGVDLDTLSGYVDNVDCPDVAYTWYANSLFVFVKNTYTYESTTLVYCWYYRNAQNIDAIDDGETPPVSYEVDIPGAMEQLALSLILRKVYIDKNIFVPQNIGQQIRTESNNLNIKYPV